MIVITVTVAIIKTQGVQYYNPNSRLADGTKNRTADRQAGPRIETQAG